MRDGLGHSSRTGGRHHAQHLADLDAVRVVQVVPACQIARRLSVVETDADQGIAGADGVKTGLASVFDARRWFRHRRRGGLNGDRRHADRSGTAVLDRRRAERTAATAAQ